jgi:integrase
MLPNLTLLEQISQRIKNIPNQQGEYKRKIHYGLFLLGLKAGLRVSEAISFDLDQKTKKCLYSVKSKGQKNRYVFIPVEVIDELKKQNWQPSQTNR